MDTRHVSLVGPLIETEGTFLVLCPFHVIDERRVSLVVLETAERTSMTVGETK